MKNNLANINQDSVFLSITTSELIKTITGRKSSLHVWIKRCIFVFRYNIFIKDLKLGVRVCRRQNKIEQGCG